MSDEPIGNTWLERPVWLCGVACTLIVGVALGVRCHEYQSAQRIEFGAPSLLFTLAARGDADGVRSLVDADAIRSGERQIGPANLEFALRLAAGYGQEPVVAALLERGVDPDAANRNGVTALMQTVSGADGVSVARRLIDAGADVDAADEGGRTVLMDAVAAGHTELVRILLEAGADVHAADRRNRTALIEAERCGDPELLRLVTACGRGPASTSIQTSSCHVPTKIR